MKGLEYGYHWLWWGIEKKRKLKGHYSKCSKINNVKQRSPSRITLTSPHGRWDVVRSFFWLWWVKYKRDSKA
jgi:hypothetical protein